MRNPFRNEADAFRLVLLAVGYFALIVVAAAINTWLGVAVFVLLTLLAIAVVIKARREPPQRAVIRPSAPGERRILVIANETVGGTPLRGDPPPRGGRRGARARRLPGAHVAGSLLRRTRTARGPRRKSGSNGASSGCASSASRRRARSATRILQAIEDGLRTFGADEVIISTHPEGRSVWLEKGVVRAARERFDVPITHVVVDLEAEAGTPEVERQEIDAERA